MDAAAAPMRTDGMSRSSTPASFSEFGVHHRREIFRFG